MAYSNKAFTLCASLCLLYLLQNVLFCVHNVNQFFQKCYFIRKFRSYVLTTANNSHCIHTDNKSSFVVVSPSHLSIFVYSIHSIYAVMECACNLSNFTQHTITQQKLFEAYIVTFCEYYLKIGKNPSSLATLDTSKYWSFLRFNFHACVNCDMKTLVIMFV